MNRILLLLKKVKDTNLNVRTILVSAYYLLENPIYLQYMNEGIIDLIIEKSVTIQRLSQLVKYEFENYKSIQHLFI
jgi:hypothetical protein